MIAHLIRWSVRNRFFVLIGMLALVGAGLWAVRSTPIDALPDLSDVQVVIRTSYPGQAPQMGAFAGGGGILRQARPDSRREILLVAAFYGRAR
ncbi:efflux RND transporter permease subunit, partial [Sphingomonas sp. Root720]|uniref:efflux RND transporter permease subunit n=1 Tax=Sphingomonas sp. Root720 TaxID=1736595 RepID=UPI000A9E078C